MFLNEYEREYGALTGVRRMNAAIQDRRVNARGKRIGNGWNDNIIGALGEMAFCKWAGIHYRPTWDTFKEPDVILGNGSMTIEIKTRTFHHYNLLINEHDSKRDLWFALVIGDGESGEFTIRGGLHASSAINEEWITDPGDRNSPVYMVPNSELIGPDEFKKKITELATSTTQLNSQQ